MGPWLLGLVLVSIGCNSSSDGTREPDLAAPVRDLALRAPDLAARPPDLTQPAPDLRVVDLAPVKHVLQFAPLVALATGRGPVSVGAADLNGDGKPDFAVSDGTSN